MRKDFGLRAEGQQVTMVNESDVLHRLFPRRNPVKRRSTNSNRRRDTDLSADKPCEETTDIRLIFI